jgi:SAM-dependent methyltransferase
MLRAVVKALKKIPIDFGQYEVRYTSKGKLIAYELAGDGRGKKALDLGCRDGYWSQKLAQKGYEVVSGDLEPQWAGGIVLDANKRLPFPDNQFDLVWCSEVIEHLNNPAFTISEIERVLRPHGSLLLTTPNRDFWFYRLLAGLGASPERVQSEDHLHFFTFGDMRKLLGGSTEYGFFPYFLYKRTITRRASTLSPTIVVHQRKPA